VARVTSLRRVLPAGIGFSSYARLLEEAATTASAQAGYPAEWYVERASAWFIRRSTIECPLPLEPGCEVEVSTWVADFRRVRSRREYTVRVAGRTEVALTAHTDWVYVDRAAGRPRRIPDEMMRAFVPDGEIAELPRASFAIPPPPADAASVERDVAGADLDALGHVNNARYLDYVDQSARLVVDAALIPRSYDVEYLTQAHGGERLLCRSWSIDRRADSCEVATEVRRASDGVLLAHARGLWRR
jgi:acyl-CoA thioester hydrolase